MPTPTPRIGYQAPLTSDPYDTSEESDRWFLADDYPGVFICTSSTRPSTWDSTQEGMLIFETDSDLMWRWNGSAFVRFGALGHLDTNRRSSNLVVASGAFTTFAQVSITVPEGDRAMSVTVSWGEISGGPARIGIFRGVTMVTDWVALVGNGGSYTHLDLDPAAGATDYIAKIKNTSTTTTLVASATSPGSISVVEV